MRRACPERSRRALCPACPEPVEGSSRTACPEETQGSGPTFLPPPPQGRGIPGQARNDEAGSAKRSDAESSAVTKYDRALAAFLVAEAAVNAAADEPDEDRYDALLGRLNNARSLS